MKLVKFMNKYIRLIAKITLVSTLGHIIYEGYAKDAHYSDIQNLNILDIVGFGNDEHLILVVDTIKFM